MWVWNTKQAEKSVEGIYVDEDFMKDLVVRLETRWNLEEPKNTKGDDTYIARQPDTVHYCECFEKFMGFPKHCKELKKKKIYWI